MEKIITEPERLMQLSVSAEDAEIGFWEWDVKDNKVTWSNNVYKIYGVAEHEFSGTFEDYRSRIHPEDLNLVDSAIAHALNSRKNYTFQHRLLWPDETVHWLEAMGSVVTSQSGEVIKIAGFVREITNEVQERLQTEDTIRRQNVKLISIAADLKRKVNKLEEFTHIVSHNLRSPINNIVSLIEIYRQATDDGCKAQAIDMIDGASKNIQNTLKELSEVLLVELKAKIIHTQCSFADTFVKVKSLLQARINECGAQVSSDFKRARSIFYPQIYLESIVLNLMSNALKYRRPGVPPVIQFSSYARDGKIILECSDNGSGIDLVKHKNEIFKLHKTFHAHPESQGFGLFLIKSQVESMGGEILVKSKVNEGSQFIVFFNIHKKN